MKTRKRFRSSRLGVVGTVTGAILIAASGHAQTSRETSEPANASYDPQALKALSQRLVESAPAPGDPAPPADAGDPALDPAGTPQARVALPSGGGSVSAQAVALPSGPSSV